MTTEQPGAATVRAQLDEAARLFENLRRPFEESDLEWRVMWSKEYDNGPLILVTPYVRRPALINRFNQVCGLAGWATDARSSDGHISVGVGVYVAGRWVWRWDGTGPLDHDPSGKGLSRAEAGKGDFSNAFKRACEQFGCALYLRELKPLKAIVDDGGRYKAKVGNNTVRWHPPSIDGTPSYPGTIPGLDASEGGEVDPPPEPNNDGPLRQSGAQKPPRQAEKPKPPTPEEEAELIRDARAQLSRFMKDNRFMLYHLEALLQTHPKLKQRYPTPEKLGELGTIDDWRLLLEVKPQRWEGAPRELADTFPADPDRIMVLDGLMDTKGIDSSDRILIESAKSIGWNDAVEWWIEELEKR